MRDRVAAGITFELSSAMVGRVDLGAGTVVVEDDSFTITIAGVRADDRRWRTRLDGIVAVQCDDDTVTVALRDGSRLALRLPEGSALHATLMAGCRAMPELTRALRAMGSRRSGAQHREGGPAEEVAFFAPLLASRRAAAEGSSPHQVISAFDARALSRSLDDTLARFAAARAGDRAPLRRALEAELGEIAEPLRAALAALESAARDATGGVDDLERWRRWSSALRLTFDTADRVWVSLNTALAAPVPAPAAPRRPGLGRRARSVIVTMTGATAIGMAVPGTSAAQHRILQVVGVPVDSLIRRGFDVVDRRGSDAVIVANPDDEAILRGRGWNTIEIRPTRIGGAALTRPPVVFRSYDDPVRGVRVFLDSLARANARVHLDTIGATYENRPMLAVKIGPADDSPSRANVIILATYHAREWAATETALRLIKYLATGTDARVDSLTRNRDIWILPVANPDGYQYTFTNDRLWRKNRRPVGGTGPSFGVDLNRNHTYLWGFDNNGSSGSVNSETYRGPSAASELEIKAIEAFHVKHPPVASISYHTYSGLMLFPPGNTTGVLPADLGIFRTLGGNDERPGAFDRLPLSTRTVYHTAPGWNLYPTNGEYTDYAYGTFGTIAFTPELSSGYEGTPPNGYYGFEFPDDEVRLDILFRDQLPFALDLIESVADPVKYVSPTTQLFTEPLVVETLMPEVRLRTRVGTSVTVTGNSPLTMSIQPSPVGKYFQRQVSDLVTRFSTLRVSGSLRQWEFTALSVGGAETGETGWTTTGAFNRVAPAAVGAFSWAGSSGSLRSPLVAVPADIDTVSVLYWTKFNGDGNGPRPHGEVRLSLDRGATWTRVGSVSGAASVFYPERVLLAGVAAKTIQVEFSSPDGLLWWIDEATILSHRVTSTVVASDTPLRPNANPVRGNTVSFNWPFGATAGEIRAYDFSGRQVWRTPVAASSVTVPWDLRSASLPNGVYLVVAQSKNERRTFKLFVTRPRLSPAGR